MASVFEGDLFVNGALTAQSMIPPSSSVNNNTIVAAANIEASKLEHQYEILYAQESNLDALIERKVLHVVKGATGSLLDFRVGAVVAAGAGGSAVVNLLKNGTSILSAPITLDQNNAAYATESAPGYVTTTLAAGEVLELSVTGSTAVKPKGLFAQLVIRERAQ